METQKSPQECAEVLYEDDALLVCVKPRGVLSCADASGKRCMNDLLAPRRIYPVHRLDREVGGLMVFAKTADAAAFLSGAELRKEYLAECEGSLPDEGEMVDLLYHDRVKNKTYVVKRKRGGVKEARLTYRVVGRSDGRTIVRIRLQTGRTHQIRVQFASRGCPLCGDRKYGAKSGGSIALTSVFLAFPHPDGRFSEFSLSEAIGETAG